MKKTNRELKKSGPRRGQNKDTYKTKASNNNSNSGSGILPQCCYRQNGTVLAQDCNNCTRPGLYCTNCPPPVSESSSKTNIERRLSNIIKRNISEMALELTEEPKKCDGKSNGDCCEGQFCSTFATGQGGEGVCKGTCDEDMVTGGKGKGRGRGKKSYSDRLPHSKYASKNIVKSLKEELLTERKWCWWRSNMEDQGGNKCEKSRNLDFSNEDCQTRAHCLGPDGENVVQTNNGGIKTYGKKLKQSKEASKHIMKIKESELINLVKRTLLKEQQGTVWCQACGQTYAMNNPQAHCHANSSKPCHPSFNLNSVSCQLCKNFMQHPNSTTNQINNNIDQYCNQVGQPCYTAVNPYVSPGKGWAQSPKGSDIKARKRPTTYSGTDGTKIRVGESQLINIIKRTINESQLLNEEVECEKHSDCKDTCNRAKCGGGECYIPWNAEFCDPTGVSNGGSGGTTKTFSGPWSDIANGVRQAKAAGGFKGMSDQEVLLWIQGVMKAGPPGPGTGQKKACQGANQFGGERCCLTVGWKEFGLKCTIGKIKKDTTP